MSLNKFGMYTWTACCAGWTVIAWATELKVAYAVALGCGMMALWHFSLEEEE